MSIIHEQVISFIVMFIIGISLNPMNVLANSFDDLYLSYTLMYGGLLMASNMMWSHQIIHYITHNNFSTSIFVIGVILSILSVILLRQQLFVDKHQWLKRMISHHSTALTTTTQLLKNKENNKDKKLRELGNAIINVQKDEINIMKDMLK